MNDSFGGRDRRLFVDTSAYYAATDRGDANHEPIVVTMRQFVSADWTLVTTNVILIELHALLLNRLGRQVALAARVELRASQTVVRISEEDETRAEAILVQYTDKDFSLADALSFAVMERLGIRVAFTLDRHFAQFGWQVIPAMVARGGR